MQVEDNCCVAIDYTVKDDEGTVVDTSEGRDPLVYLHGHNNIVPGLEKALVGKSEGDELEVKVEPGEGYGERVEELVQDVPREMFQGVDDIQPGMQFQAQTANGPQIVTVSEVGDESVKVDGNHPMAGKTLHFDVKVANIREATEEEIEHGHAHEMASNE